MGGWRSMDLDVVDLIYYLRSYQQILKYINLEPKETTPLGSCIGTWNELLGKERKKKESGAGSSVLSSNTPGFGSTPRHWPCPILRPSHRLVIHPSHRWFDPFGSKPRCWVLPSAVGFYPLSLGSTLCRWVLPFVVGFYPLLFIRKSPSVWHGLACLVGLAGLAGLTARNLCPPIFLRIFI